MHRALLYLTLIAGTLTLPAAEPSEKFDVPGERRTRTCAPMIGEKIPLRFPDGTPTGFFARADDPSQEGGHKGCPPGSLELDAQETITSADGQVSYFHPGGGSSFYKDYIHNGQYGHVFASDLKDPPKPKPQKLNGKPAPLAKGDAYVITPTRIPQDMFYKPDHSGSKYATYGNPGFDKTAGHGDWTYLSWSWVQNGGAEYPANITAGGGLVRALGKRGTVFRAADVAPIVGYSYGKDNAVNGRVTAIYGQMWAGPGEKGSSLYGWLALSYQKTGSPVVYCLERLADKSATTQPVPAKR